MFTQEQRERLIALMQAASLTNEERQEMNGLAAEAIKAGVFEAIEAEVNGESAEKPKAEAGAEKPEDKPKGKVEGLVAGLAQSGKLLVENASLKRERGKLQAENAQLIAKLAEAEKQIAEYEASIQKLEAAAKSVQASVTEELAQAGLPDQTLPGASAENRASSVGSMTDAEFSAYHAKLPTMKEQIAALRERDAAKKISKAA